jgi:membrane protein implicated in regulation of membrane protease activity
VAFAGEVAFWHRKVRGQPRAVGRRRLVGKKGVVVSACFPEGQARIDGTIWAARCESGAAVGETVWVVGLEELTLIVERRDS